mgnify:CR=1 FL=1
MKKMLVLFMALGTLLSGCVTYGAPYHDRNRDGGYDRTERDRDRDGITDRVDRDRDGDGVPNRQDRRPDDSRRY